MIAGNVWLRCLEPSWLRFLAKRASYAALLLLSRPLGYLPVRAERRKGTKLEFAMAIRELQRG